MEGSVKCAEIKLTQKLLCCSLCAMTGYFL